MFFNTPLSHFHTLHTFTSLFYIYTYAKIFIFTFGLIMIEFRSKRRAVLPLDFTSHCFQKPLLVSTYYFPKKKKRENHERICYERFCTVTQEGNQCGLSPFTLLILKTYISRNLIPRVSVFAFSTTMETLGTRLIFRALVLVFI